jgi:hypothetical protein
MNDSLCIDDHEFYCRQHRLDILVRRDYRLLLFCLEALQFALNDIFNGVTYLWPTIPGHSTSNTGWIDPNEYYVTFTLDTHRSFRNRLIIGSIDQVNSILSGTLTFYDNERHILHDENGQQLHFTSTRIQLGQLFDFMPSTLMYDHATIMLTLSKTMKFDPRTLFFHFPIETDTLPPSLPEDLSLINSNSPIELNDIEQSNGETKYIPSDK